MIVLKKIKKSINLVIEATLTKVDDSTVDSLFTQTFPSSPASASEFYYGKVFYTPSNFKADNIFVNYNGQQLTNGSDFDVWGDNVISFKYITPNDNFEIINATYELA